MPMEPPKTRLALYREPDGTVPLRDWLDALPRRTRAKGLVRMERLRALGRELRRPESEELGDGLHALRFRAAGLRFRILYFFSDRGVAVLTHGLVKPRATVPRREVEHARRRRAAFETDREASGRESGLRSLRRRYLGDDHERIVELEEARFSAAVACQIHDLRSAADLTQRELAARVGTQHSIIGRLENDDYDGSLLSMLHRVAAAVGKRVEIRFVVEDRT